MPSLLKGKKWIESKHQLPRSVFSLSFFVFLFFISVLCYFSLIVTGDAESASEPYSELR